MILTIAGGALIFFGGILDMFFRDRLWKLGNKMAMIRGGAFDYRAYHRERGKQGWAAWPVWVMWAAYIIGIACLLIGFILTAGTPTPHSS